MNTDELRALLAAKRVTQVDLCRTLGIDPSTFYRKIYGDGDFTRAQIQKISEALELTNEDILRIFFNR